MCIRDSAHPDAAVRATSVQGRHVTGGHRLHRLPGRPGRCWGALCRRSQRNRRQSSRRSNWPWCTHCAEDYHQVPQYVLVSYIICEIRSVWILKFSHSTLRLERLRNLRHYMCDEESAARFIADVYGQKSSDRFWRIARFVTLRSDINLRYKNRRKTWVCV